MPPDLYPFLSFPKLILRSPLFSYQNYSPDKISKIMENCSFRAAILLASSDFYQALESKNFEYHSLTIKEQLTVQKYYNRMCFRPTPFGAFSSISVVNWEGQSGWVCLEGLDKAILKLIPDHAESISFVEHLFENNITFQSFTANPTLYQLAKECRFIKTVVNSSGMDYKYSLQSFVITPILKRIIAYINRKRKVNYAEVESFIISISGCSGSEAKDFLQFLVQSQIILSISNMTLLGDDFLQVLKQIHFLNSDQVNDLYSKGPLNTDHIEKQVARLKLFRGDSAMHKAANLFYASLHRSATGSLQSSIKDQIDDSIAFLKEITFSGKQNILKNFVEKFKHRYDLQSVPLLQALDPEIGINYGTTISLDEQSSLLNEIMFDPVNELPPTIEWTALHRLLLSKWPRQRQNIITLLPDDLASYTKQTYPTQLNPTSFSVMFGIINNKILLEAVGGASAISLMGRFTVFDNDIWETAKEIAETEQNANPGVVFAEISNISNSHTDNINRRLPVYDYEININCSPCALVNQISLNDLMLRIIDDELILESVSLSKRVIPRLSSAYNYQKNELSIFRFLGDLQYQNIHDNWQIDLELLFPALSRYPRVEYKNTVLALAKWHLNEKDIEKLTTLSRSEAVSTLCTKYDIAGWIALSSFDQQLIFNLNDDLQCELFLNCIRPLKKAVIREYLYPQSTHLQSKEGYHVNQFIAVYLNEKPVYKPLAPKKINLKKTKRHFTLGSDWLYVKVYCSPSVSNKLLTKKISPLLDLMTPQIAKKWFFVRYQENGYHLRIRINASQDQIGYILKKLNICLNESIDYHLIRVYQADTYQRELERYGSDIISNVEEIFYHSSIVTIRYFKNLQTSHLSDFYNLFAFKTTLDIIKLIYPKVEAQLTFSELMKNQLMREYRGSKKLKYELDKKYRELSPLLSNLIESNELYVNYKSLSEIKALKSALSELFKISSINSEKRITTLAADLIHMHLNRCFVEKQRNQELIIYHCLSKMLKSEVAKSGKNLLANY